MAEDRRVVAESSRLLLALADSNSAAGLRLIDACCIFLIQYSHARLMPCIPRLHASTQLEGHARVGRMLWMRSGGGAAGRSTFLFFLVFSDTCTASLARVLTRGANSGRSQGGSTCAYAPIASNRRLGLVGMSTEKARRSKSSWECSRLEAAMNVHEKKN